MSERDEIRRLQSVREQIARSGFVSFTGAQNVIDDALEYMRENEARARIAEQREAELTECLDRLLPAHKAGLSLDHNQHRNVYDTAEQWIVDNDWCDWESDEAKQQAIEADSIWTLQWYPDTPIGFYAVAAPTLTDLLRFAANVERES